MYQALYRKYRPKTFDEVVGQTAVTQTLRAQVCAGKLSHAYLFTGTRGTGKTTCARILAKAVNCLSPQDGNPCNCCAACKSIDDESCTDVVEIDAASNNGVDDIRSLRDEAVYSPAELKKRVYIVDEVHMLSTSAFNALLKIIEEPPEHLMFILATTDLQKVPATILSRCQHFSFRRLSQKDIAGRLNWTAHQEGIDVDMEALNLLARLADGALRDGMSLFDQCSSAASGKVTTETVYTVLGLAGDRKTASLMEAVESHNVQSALEQFAALYAAGKDVQAVLNELMMLVRDLLLLKTAPQGGGDMLSGVCTDEELERLLGKISAGELLYMASLLQSTCAGFSKSANRRMDAELCLMQLCSPSLRLDAASLGARVSKIEDILASGQLTMQRVSAETSDAVPEVSESIAVKSEPMPDVKPVPQPETAEMAELWQYLKERVKPQLKQNESALFQDGCVESVQINGDTLTLIVKNNFVKATLDTENVLGPVRNAVAAKFQQPMQVKICEQDKYAQTVKATFDESVNGWKDLSDNVEVR